MLNILPKIPLYFLFRLIGRPRKLPLNLTLSLSFKCNSRCKTCNIYSKRCKELSLAEWEKIFISLGTNPFWITISGGEPFLRTDLYEIVCSLYDHCQPAIINIPSNGLLNKRIPETVEKIVKYCKQSQVVINLSLDDIGEKHDEIRGVTNNYDKTTDTLSALKKLKADNLTIGVHTVISQFNVDRIPLIQKHILTFAPDSYITEIAEQRVELGTINCEITPDYKDYEKAVDCLINELKKNRFKKVGQITRAFRIEYYQLVKRILKQKRQVIPCYSGFASAQVAPDGDVWMCCIKADPIGNLVDADYDFSKVWFSEKAKKLRQGIKRGECYCPLANASYTNMLHNYRSLSRVMWNLIKMN